MMETFKAQGKTAALYRAKEPGKPLIILNNYDGDGNSVLEEAEDCTFDENWGALVELGYMKNSSGVASEGARVSNYEGTDYDPMLNFSTPVYKFADELTEVSITVNADGTYTYNVAARSDDD